MDYIQVFYLLPYVFHLRLAYYVLNKFTCWLKIMQLILLCPRVIVNLNKNKSHICLLFISDERKIWNTKHYSNIIICIQGWAVFQIHVFQIQNTILFLNTFLHLNTFNLSISKYKRYFANQPPFSISNTCIWNTILKIQKY